MNSKLTVDEIKLDAILMLSCYAGTSEEVLALLDISMAEFQKRALEFDPRQDTNCSLMVHRLFLSYARHSKIKNWKVVPRGL